MIKINTNYWPKPIPPREFDWAATYDDYEGGDGYGEPAGQIGYGATEADAVIDLIENHYRGIWCERDRHCVSCVHRGDRWWRDYDGAQGSQAFCERHHHNILDTLTSVCGDHAFEGELDMERTIPASPPPPEDEIRF